MKKDIIVYSYKLKKNIACTPDGFSSVTSADKRSLKSVITEKSLSDTDAVVIYNGTKGKTNAFFREAFADSILYFESLLNSEKNAEQTKKIKIFSIGPVHGEEKGYCFLYAGKLFVAVPELDSPENGGFFDECILRAQKIIEQNSVLFPNGIKLKDRVPKKKRKLSDIILPRKNDSKKEIIRKTVSMLAAVTLLVSAAALSYNLIFKSIRNDMIQSEVQDIFYGDSSGKAASSKEKATNWKKLRKINSDIVGWVKIDGTKIDYPVLYSKSDNAKNMYYLNHNYKKQSSSYGAIYLDYRCYNGLKSKNLVLHGHSMNDGSMFKDLLNYGTTTGKLSYYKKHPVISFSTPRGSYTYKIISVFKANTVEGLGEVFPYMQGKFLSNAEFMNYVYQVRVRSLFNCPVDVNENDSLITLSTCSYEFDGFRTVVVARKLRSGETAAVDTKNATLNKSARFPECYYRKYGGTQPEDMTFREALKKGKADWYDGSGRLRGDEALTAGTEPTTAKVYTLKLLNYDGSVFLTKKVVAGSSVKETGHPTKPSTKNYTYRFVKWNKSLKNIQSDITAKPIFKKEKIKQTTKKTAKKTASKAASKSKTKTKTTKKTVKATKQTTPTQKPTGKASPSTKETSAETTEPKED